MKSTALSLAVIVLAANTAFSGDGNVRRSARRIPGRYIVVLESTADTAAVVSTARNLKGQVRHTYERGVKGFALEMGDADAQMLAKDARVQFVEEDSTISAWATPWGLDRIDQRSLPLNDSYVSGGRGAGVNVYVLDTGILAAHVDFGGRVAAGFSAFADNGGTQDCNGHGTHVAGVIGGSHYGVAPSATLIPVRVLDCSGSGSISTLIAGIDWVLQNQAQSSRPAVVNMSLGGDASSALDAAVNRLLAADLTAVVAAGNSNVDACAKSPARVPGALTVGASTETDQRAAFSNYGACVDLFAPGINIQSDWYTSPTATAVSNGTSMAAPFVAGVAALCLEKYPNASPSVVSQTILSQATIDALGAVGTGSPNRLLFSLIGSLSDFPVGDSQLLGDPGLEYGTIFWTSDICTVIQPTGCPPEVGGESFPAHSGDRRASLGGTPRSFHLTSEAITIPSTVRSAELSFYLWIVTTEKSKKSSGKDVLKVEILNQSGKLLETLGTFSNLDACPNYLKRRFDMKSYRGKTIRISFTGIQDQGQPTWFVLDDIALNIWR